MPTASEPEPELEHDVAVDPAALGVAEESDPADELAAPPQQQQDEDAVQVEHHEHHELLPLEEEHLIPHPPPMEVEPTTGTVEDPLAPAQVQIDEQHLVDPEQAALDAGEEAAAEAMEAAAAAEAAEAAIGNVLDDVGVDVHAHHHHVEQHLEQHHHHHHVEHHHHEEDDEVALAAAAAAAAVQAADGMAVVVDQALLATAAAAAASQVAEVLADQTDDYQHQEHDTGVAFPPPLPQAAATQLVHYPDYHDDQFYDDGSPGKLNGDHGELLEARRQKDRKRYSAMTPDARAAYNAHRRELYHKQGENARKRRRERERERYHSLEGDSKKHRNERRAKLERDRYNRLSKDELAGRNSKRRDRAKTRKVHVKTMAVAPHAPVMEETAALTIPPPGLDMPPPIKTEMVDDGGGVPHIPDMHDAQMTEADIVGAPLPEATVDVTDAASALAAEVAEQVIAGTNLEDAMEAAAAVGHTQSLAEEDGPTVQI